MMNVDALAWAQEADRQRDLFVRILLEGGGGMSRGGEWPIRWYGGRLLFVPKASREVPLQPGLSCRAQEWAERAEGDLRRLKLVDGSDGQAFWAAFIGGWRCDFG